VVFNRDGKTLASGSSDGTIILWDVETGQPIGQLLSVLSGSITTLAFSPDGKTLVSSGWAGTIILWDVKTRQAIGQPLSVLSGRVNILAFSPDGKTLVSGGDDRKLILLDMDPLSWIQATCQRVGRNFTRAEWERYFPNEEYRKTCEQWPLESKVTPTAKP